MLDNGTLHLIATVSCSLGQRELAFEERIRGGEEDGEVQGAALSSGFLLPDTQHLRVDVTDVSLLDLKFKTSVSYPGAIGGASGLGHGNRARFFRVALVRSGHKDVSLTAIVSALKPNLGELGSVEGGQAVGVDSRNVLGRALELISRCHIYPQSSSIVVHVGQQHKDFTGWFAARTEDRLDLIELSSGAQVRSLKPIGEPIDG